jgi:hypothetical protein
MLFHFIETGHIRTPWLPNRPLRRRNFLVQPGHVVNRYYMDTDIKDEQYEISSLLRKLSFSFFLSFGTF